ncbi:MAG: leucine-rich repeat protein [Oscillospiraceae bacterium]|nr:leucine-rich repeat protein [Oscillospiraceae bacterium]
MSSKKKNVYPAKEKSLGKRILVIIMCAAMVLGFIALPLFSVFASAEEDDSTIVVKSFEKGQLQSAVDEARGSVDFNNIKRLAVMSGTLASNDYGAIMGLPNLEFIELSGCEAENGVFPDNAIQSRNNLTYISLPKNTVEIGRAALANNKRLTKIDMPDCVERILDYAFENCEGLTDITLPLGLKTLSPGVFNNCRSLTSIDLPLGLKAIPDNCFTRCYGLTDLHIPPTVDIIGMNAFADCDSLKGIYFYSEIAPTPGGGMFPQNGRPTVHAVPDAIGFDDGEWTKAPVEYDVDPDQPYYYRETEEPTAIEEPVPPETAPADDKAEAEETKAETEAAVSEKTENNEPEPTEAAPANTESQTSGGVSAGTLVLIIVIVVLIASGVSAAVTVIIIKKNKKD